MNKTIMKTILTFVLGVFATMSTQTFGADFRTHQMCLSVEKAAQETQRANQQGRSISEIVEIVSTMPIEAQPTMLELVKDAYKQTRWHSVYQKERAIIEFGEKWYKECMINTEKFVM